MAPRKFPTTTTALILIGTLVISSCTLKLPFNPVNPVQSEFNLAKGTSWIYSESDYQPAPGDPTQVVTAQFQITETVTETSSTHGVFYAHVQSEEKPIQVPAEVPANYFPFSPSGDFWYRIQGRQVFQSGGPADFTTEDTDTLPLAFDFPLSVNHSWCPVRIDLKNPNHPRVTNCDNGGKLTVLQQSTHQVPAGKFENCFQIEEFANDGPLFQWFCKDIGMVEIDYDHNGTRFGFKQVLTVYDPGSR
ncbi:MAG: hypothetical protein ABSB41_17640 [Anaerolineales bacterium]|jgi:hypothetical protein